MPNAKVKDVARMLKAIHAQESLPSAKAKARDITDQLRQMRLSQAARLVESAIDELASPHFFGRDSLRG